MSPSGSLAPAAEKLMLVALARPTGGLALTLPAEGASLLSLSRKYAPAPTAAPSRFFARPITKIRPPMKRAKCKPAW